MFMHLFYMVLQHLGSYYLLSHPSSLSQTGHGFQWSKDSDLDMYLVPVLGDGDKLSDTVEMDRELVSEQYLRQKFHQRKTLFNLIILDCCRTRPPWHYILDEACLAESQPIIREMEGRARAVHNPTFQVRHFFFAFWFPAVYMPF